MSRPGGRQGRADAGFTLFEALVAIALMGLIVGGLATVTAQWLPNWNRGQFRTQRNERVAIALDRLVDDLSAAQYVSPNRAKPAPLFRGDEFSEIVQIAETVDSRGRALVRTRAPFAPLATGDPLVDPIPFADPVVLIRAPLRIAFAYAGPDGKWENAWRDSEQLPTAVRFDVREGDAGPVVSTAARVHIGAKAPVTEPADEARPDAAQAQPNNAPETK